MSEASMFKVGDEVFCSRKGYDKYYNMSGIIVADIDYNDYYTVKLSPNPITWIATWKFQESEMRKYTKLDKALK